MLARLKPLLSPQHIRNIIFTTTTQNKEKIVKKIEADAIAIAMARDILRTSSHYQRNIDATTARDIAEFINSLSEIFQNKLDDGIDSSQIINAYKNQSDK
jgi:hypothetical protein